jgi:hypothetical protein
MAELAITVLDVPVIGSSRSEVADLVDRLRGRSSAVAFARRHHAGTAADHIGRFALLAEHGVRTVFLAPPILSGPDEVLALAPVVSAFG